MCVIGKWLLKLPVLALNLPRSTELAVHWSFARPVGWADPKRCTGIPQHQISGPWERSSALNEKRHAATPSVWPQPARQPLRFIFYK